MGPIGLLCIHRSLAQSSLHGFLTGLGAATADALYALVAGLGLAGVSAVLVGQQVGLRGAAGALLLVLAWRTMRAPVAAGVREAADASYLGTYLSSVLLTITNPATILSFVAAFTGFGLAQGQDAAPLVLGVFLGSALWWVFLSTATGLFRARMNERRIRAVNFSSGALLAGFGLWAWAGIF